MLTLACLTHFPVTFYNPTDGAFYYEQGVSPEGPWVRAASFPSPVLLSWRDGRAIHRIWHHPYMPICNNLTDKCQKYPALATVSGMWHLAQAMPNELVGIF